MMAIGAYSYLIFILIIFQYGFWIYTLTPHLWDVYSAEIISSEPYTFRYKDEELVDRVQLKKEFSVNNLLRGCFPIAPDEGKGDTIKIAINKKYPGICIRVDWITLGELRFASLIMLFIVTIQNIEWFTKGLKKRRRSNVTIISQLDDD